MAKQKRKIGLALGGGAVLGAAHVGMLKAFEEAGMEARYIAGTSIGAFVGAFYAFGMPLDELEEVASTLKWNDISRISFSRHGLMSNEKLGKFIREQLGDKMLEDSPVPLAMVATDITSGEKVVLKEGPVDVAVMASTCVPGVFKAVEVGDRLLVDGGVVENVPINTVREMGAGYVIGVDLNAEHTYERPRHALDVLLNSFHFLLKTTTEHQTEKADLLIQPDLSEFNRSDIKQIPDLMKKGYKDTKDALEGIPSRQKQSFLQKLIS